VAEVRRVTTARLQLDVIAPTDLSALFPIFNDAAGWWYDPPSRHLDVEQSDSWIRRAAQRWSTDGLSYWTVRLIDAEEVIGVGGVQRHASGSWNLYYRLATSHWGCGYAAELASTALTTAHTYDDGVPVVAWIAERNQPSRLVAERIGLRNLGLRIDTNDGQHRLAYADRELPPA
jgi:RimJ/RimL family protein N-acetyltransferase